MAKLFARVGSGIGGDASDPAAAAAGVRADIDEWRGEDGTRYLDYYLLASTRRALEDYVADLSKQADFAIDAKHLLLVGPADPGSWRTYYVRADKLIDASAIDQVEVGTNPASGTFVGLTMTTEGRNRLAAVTGKNIGRKLATVLEGTVTTAAVVTTAIDGGRLAIAVSRGGAATEREAADALAARIRCP